VTKENKRDDMLFIRADHSILPNTKDFSFAVKFIKFIEGG
jgi:hypothetical protein